MKIAILLSGEPRDFEYVFKDLESKLSTNQCDLFIHTWHNPQKGLSNLPLHRERGGETFQKFLTVISTGQYLDSLRPKQFLAENYFESPPYVKFQGDNKTPTTVARMHSMFYSIQKCFELTPYNKYDLYVRARPDLFLERKINYTLICDTIKSNPNLVIFPDLFINVGGESGPWAPQSNYVPDFMWVGGPLMARQMLNVYNDIDMYCGKHLDKKSLNKGSWPSVPEHYLMRYLKFNNFKIGKLNLKIMLARQHKEISQTGKFTF